MYDVAIIGLGPAGAMLAQLLHPRLKVIAIDRKTGDGGGFHKPCGGLLATDAQKALSRFGLTLPLEVLVDPQIFSVRTVDVATGLVRHYQRFYMNLDRHKFDLWLRSLIPPHVEVVEDGRCTAISSTADGYLVEYRVAQQDYTVEARYVVGADGANSLVRCFLYPQAKIRQYLSIQQWFPDLHASPFYSCVFDSRATDCYAWGLSKEHQFIFGGAFSPQGGREQFEALKERLADFGFRLGTPLKTEACLVLRPQGLGDFCCCRDGAFLVGEAAGFISPSSLEGISYALNSALALSQVLNGGAPSPHRAYRRKTRGIRLRLFAKHLKSPFMYQPLLRRLVMASGVASIDVLRDDIFPKG